MLDLKRVTVLREVANQGSFSAAAEALFLSQPAVSQQIAALERETGIGLVERSPRGIRLTQAGTVLLAHAEDIFERVAAAEADLEALAGLRAGSVRIASFPTAGAALVPLAIKAFADEHPDVAVSLEEQEPERSVPALRAGELDVALVFDYHDLHQPELDLLYEGVELHELLEDPMSVALPAEHPLAGEPVLDLADLRGETWIQNDPTGPCGRLHLAACRASGFTPRVGFRSDDYNVVQGLVAAGVGISLFPALAFANRREDVVIRSLGPDAPKRRVLAAVRASACRTPATAAFLDTLVDVSNAYRPSMAT